MIRRKLLKLGTSICIFSVICTLSLTGCNNSKENDGVVETEMVTETTEEESIETEDTEKVESTEECINTEEAENVIPTESTEGTSTETTKQEESGSTTSTESSGGSTSSNSGSNSSSSNSGSSSSSSSSGSSSSSSSSSATTHTHNWTPVYRTVHHDAVTHTEDQGHYEDQGYRDIIYTCNTCGFTASTPEEVHDHQKATALANPDNPDLWHAGDSSKSTWVSNNVWVSNIVTVTDSPAWDEQVLDHYECSCGATK